MSTPATGTKSSFCESPQCTKALQQTKEIGLHITLALSLIALIGTAIGVLALNGLPLGGINALASSIGPQYLYIGLLTSASLTAITAVLFSAHIQNLKADS